MHRPPISTLFPYTTLFRSSEPQNLIPPNVQETAGGDVVDLLYAGLYSYDLEGNLEPVLAEDVPQTEDNQVWTIQIGEGDRKSTRLNSSHVRISYAVVCWKK